MRYENEETGYPSFRRFMESGPLVLDCLKDRAFMEDECLKLTEEQFKSLYLLMQREGQFMTFEVLYKGAWEPLDYADHREAAREGLNSLMEIVNAAGQGITRIDAATEGYRYRLELVK